MDLHPLQRQQRLDGVTGERDEGAVVLEERVQEVARVFVVVHDEDVGADEQRRPGHLHQDGRAGSTAALTVMLAPTETTARLNRRR